MVQKKEKVIHGRKVEVTQFTGSQANKFFARFTQSFSAATNSISCTPDEWQSFCEDFLQFAVVDGSHVSTKELFDKAFTGKIYQVLDVVIFVAETNGFLGEGDSGSTKEAAEPPKK